MTELYKLTGNILALSEIARSDSTDEELFEAVQETINSNELEFSHKAIGIVNIATEMTGDTDKIDKEIKRLQERKRAITNRKQSLIEYLRINMEASGVKKIECPLFSITLRNGGEKVQISDESALPDDYLSIKTQITPNKVEIKKALKEGRDIPGAKLVKSKSSVLIK